MVTTFKAGIIWLLLCVLIAPACSDTSADGTDAGPSDMTSWDTGGDADIDSDSKNDADNQDDLQLDDEGGCGCQMVGAGGQWEKWGWRAPVPAPLNSL